ncbi:MAG: AsmA family protein, partial [Gammaproteobacteria bacterium]
MRRTDFRIKLLELLRGRVVMPYLRIEGLRVNLEKDAKGQANWQFTGASPAEAAAETILPEGRTDFPAISELSVRHARVVYRVAGKTLRDAQIGEATGHSDNRGIALRVEGKYQERPSQLRIDGDSVGRLWAADRPNPIEIKLETGAPPDTPRERFAAHAKGKLTNAFEAGRFGLKLPVEGSDIAQLYPLAGVVLPKTPPYSLTGMLGHKGDEWRFDGFQGRMGDSDLAGDLAIRTAADPPRMDARFVSDKLDFDDLAGLVGAPPSTEEGETASAEQKAEAKQREAEKRIIPATAIELERLHAMDIHAKLDAKRVITKRIPIDH